MTFKSVKKGKTLKPKYVLGIDPGTGSSSALGLCLMEFETKTIIFTMELWSVSAKDPTRYRIKEIVEQFKDVYDSLVDTYGAEEIGIAIESFILLGKGGETLMRLKGALLYVVDKLSPVSEIPNTAMKRISGGSGKANKEEIAANLKKLLPETEKEKINKLIFTKSWDAVDAIGIAYAGEFYENEK